MIFLILHIYYWTYCIIIHIDVFYLLLTGISIYLSVVISWKKPQWIFYAILLSISYTKVLLFNHFVGIILGMQFQGNLQLSFLTLMVEYSISRIQSITKSTEKRVQRIVMKKKECGIRCPFASLVSLQEKTYMFMYKNQVLFGIYKCHSIFYWPMHNIWRIYTGMKYM